MKESVSAAWLRCRVGRVDVCVRWGVGAVGPLLRHEPMTLKSCASRLPNNRPSAWNQTPLHRYHRLCYFSQAMRSARGQPGRKSTSFIFLVSQSFNPPPHHPPLHSTEPILHAWHWSVLQNHNRASRSTPQLTQTICRDGFWHRWQLVKPHTTPTLTFPPLYLNWQAVFLFCNAKRGFALCFSGMWACTWPNTCTTHTGGQECLFPSTTILRKEHRNALMIEVRLNAITNLIQQFI